MSGGPGGVHMSFGQGAASAVDAYVEYKRIVGDDDGGTPFTPEEYEEYKKRVAIMRTKNRLYVSWTSPTGMDCKLIGPETLCICNHRYRQHKTDFAQLPRDGPILQPCRERGCKCSTYRYLPMNGPQPGRCTCKHLPDDHAVNEPSACKKGGCRDCPGYKPSFTCGCGEPAYRHEMVVETKEERLARGHPVGQDTIYQAMGGITGFSSLAEGYLRMDPSGRGGLPPGSDVAAIGPTDHPFLRANIASIQAYGQVDEEDLAERMSAMRRPGESELDYYERRYQERQKKEREQKRIQAAPKKTATVVGQRKPTGGAKALRSQGDGSDDEELTSNRIRQGTRAQGGPSKTSGSGSQAKRDTRRY